MTDLDPITGKLAALLPRLGSDKPGEKQARWIRGLTERLGGRFDGR